MSNDAPGRFDDLPILAELRARLLTHFATAAAQPDHGRLIRGHRWRGLALIAVLVLGGTTGALAAAGVFRAGGPLAPGAPVIATRGNGAAVASSARLLALRVADPDGGPPWGVRVIHTTRDETCIQVGRVAFDTIGVLGQDGAFSNDGRFHPLSENYEEPLNCGTADAHGNAFLSDVLQNVPASAYDRGCRLANQTLPPVVPRQFAAILARNRSILAREPVCPTDELRNVFYGLLGPDATSVTYATPSGRLVTTRTVGADGAYLIVLPHVSGNALCGPHRPVCPTDQMDQSGGIEAFGVIRVVRYRNRGSCRLALPGLNTAAPGQQTSCPPVGYVPAPAQQLTPAQVAAPLTVHVVHARFYCSNDRTFEACGMRAPAGFHRLSQPPSLLVTVSFASRVAITNSNSYYYFELDNPNPESPHQSSQCGPANSTFGATSSDYRVGQRVQNVEFAPLCRGAIQGSVTLVTPTGPSVPTPMAPTAGSRNLLVGQFTIRAP